MTFHRIEEIQAWVMAQDLAVGVYQATDTSRDFAFRDQIRRATVSISSNIAEGFGRGGDPEFCRFLDIARGSAWEVASLLALAPRIGAISPEMADILAEQVRATMRKMAGLHAYLRGSRLGEDGLDYQP